MEQKFTYAIEPADDLVTQILMSKYLQNAVTSIATALDMELIAIYKKLDEDPLERQVLDDFNLGCFNEGNT